MTSVSSNTTMATFGKAFLVTVAGLAAYYNDRAVFDERRPNITTEPGSPLVGNLPMLIQYKDRIHDMFLELYHKYNSLTM